MPISPAEYQAMQARLARQDLRDTGRLRAGQCERESDLHQQILDECERRGWLVFHGSMAHKTYRTKGEPDMVILVDRGRVVLLEIKTRTGKLSTEQLAVQAHARKLGHTVHVIRSLEEFLQLPQ